MKNKNQYIKLPQTRRAFSILRDLQAEMRRLGYLLTRRDLNQFLYRMGICAKMLLNLIIIDRDDSQAVEDTEFVIREMLSTGELFRAKTSRALEEIRRKEREMTLAVEKIDHELDGIRRDVQDLGFNTAEAIRQIDAAKEALVWDLNDALKSERQEREDYNIPFGLLYEGTYLMLDDVREDYPAGTAFRIASQRAAAIETGKIICKALDAGVSKKKLAKLLGLTKEHIKYLVKMAHSEFNKSIDNTNAEV